MRVKNWMEFCRQEAVLLLSAALALLSMLAVPPDGGYRDYIDLRVLLLLFCLMAVVGSAKEQGVFSRLYRVLLRRAGSTRRAALILILLPFFCSMLVTNDVSLITFVPLAVLTLEACAPEQLCFVVVMQTVAANLGSSLTPFGNPQNLYLSSTYSIPASAFFAATGPLVAAGLVLVTGAAVLRVKDRPIVLEGGGEEGAPLCPGRLALCAALFLLSVLAVLRVLDYRAVSALVTALLLLLDRRSFRHVDVSLLLTFVCLFVFVGNMARVGPVRELLSGLIGGRELLVSALASQVISNVPAALMLSGFTKNGVGLLIGTNVGGLGTPIASMASLISLRLYARTAMADTRRYLLVFSGYNFLFLGLLLALESVL